MKTFATKEKRSAPAVHKARPYVHQPLGPVQLAQQAEVRRILRSTGAQAKLTIGQPNDKYEQEADRVADQVMAMPDPELQRQPENEEEKELIQTKPLADQITPLVQRQEKPSEEEEELQAKSTPGETPTVTSNIESRINSLKGGGQALDSGIRNFFEPRFGYDFSRVRINHGPQAADVSDLISARAFTLGKNIVFASGQYQPQSIEGKRLLGHELTHVVQQNGGADIRRQRKWKGAYGDPKEFEKMIKEIMVKKKVTRAKAKQILQQIIAKTGQSMEQAFPGLANKKYSYNVLQNITIGKDRKKPNCFGDVCKGGTQRWEPTDSELNAWLYKEKYTKLTCSSKLAVLAVFTFHGKFDIGSISQPLHIAERLSDGRWRSRMGDMGVIFHNRPGQVLSELQGTTMAKEIAKLYGYKVLSSKMEMTCYSRKKN